MANSDWVHADEVSERAHIEEFGGDYFRRYLGYLVENSPLTEDWQLLSVLHDGKHNRTTALIQFLHPFKRDQHVLYNAMSLEDLEASLITHRCPIPQSLSTILGEYRRGRDGKDAVDFYCNSGVHF